MTDTIRIYVYGKGWLNVTAQRAQRLIDSGSATKTPKPLKRSTVIKQMKVTELKNLAKAARPVSEKDYASERQIEAENLFYAEVQQVLTLEKWEKLEEFNLKATVNEGIDYALSLLD